MNVKSLKIPILYVSLILIWGSTWIAIKLSVGDVPFTMAAIRFFIAACLLIFYQLIRRQAILPPAGHTRVLLALGIGNYFIGNGFTYWGMQYVHSNITSILWATMPVQVSVFANFMLGDEKLNISKIFSLVGALIGSYLMFDVHGQAFSLQTTLGMLAILFSIAGASYSNVLYKKEGSHLDPVPASIVGMSISALLMLGTGLWLEPWSQIEFTTTSIIATAFLAIFGSAIAFTTYFWLFKHVSVVKMSYTTFIIPIIAIIWGWFLLKEALTTANMLGAAIILLAVSLPELGIFKRFLGRQ